MLRRFVWNSPIRIISLRRFSSSTATSTSNTTFPMTPKKSDIVPASLSASLIILHPLSSPTPDGYNYQLLLLKRHSKSSSFVGGHVFPGGNFESADREALELEPWISTIRKDPAAAAVGTPSTSSSGSSFPEQKFPETEDEEFRIRKLQALKVCALRETFEESGLLLLEPGEKALMWARGPGRQKKDWRTKVHNNPTLFSTLFQTLSLPPPPLSSLVYRGNWITPAHAKKRYDTHFFITVLPPPPASNGTSHNDPLGSSPPGFSGKIPEPPLAGRPTPALPTTTSPSISSSPSTPESQSQPPVPTSASSHGAVTTRVFEDGKEIVQADWLTPGEAIRLAIIGNKSGSTTATTTPVTKSTTRESIPVSENDLNRNSWKQQEEERKRKQKQEENSGIILFPPQFYLISELVGFKDWRELLTLESKSFHSSSSSSSSTSTDSRPNSHNYFYSSHPLPIIRPRKILPFQPEFAKFPTFRNSSKANEDDDDETETVMATTLPGDSRSTVQLSPSSSSPPSQPRDTNRNRNRTLIVAHPLGVRALGIQRRGLGDGVLGEGWEDLEVGEVREEVEREIEVGGKL